MTANNDEFGAAVLQNAFKLWFTPEAKRRVDEGRMTAGTPIHAAQAVIDAYRGETQVRFNEEVRCAARIKAKRELKAGQPVLASDIEEIITADLTDADPNAGHFTAIQLSDRWFMSFDFRYNTTLIQEHLGVARQFLAVAEYGYDASHLNATVENLFSCVELIAKALLLESPDKRLIDAKSHSFISTRFNLEHGQQNVPSDPVQLLNRLSLLRPVARYQFSERTLDGKEIAQLLQRARKMLDDAEARAPRRDSAKIETVGHQ